MKKFLVLMALASLMAGTAFAQMDTDPNQIGVYIDTAASNNCLETYVVDYVTTYNFYLCVTNPTVGDLAGIECRAEAMGTLGVPGGIGTVGFALQGGLLNAVPTGTDPQEIYAATGTPIVPVDNVIVVGVMNIFPLSPPGTAYLEWFVSPSFQASVDGQISYVYSQDVGTKIPLYPSSGDFGLPVATMGTACVVPSEDMSWGQVKSLY